MNIPVIENALHNITTTCLNRLNTLFPKGIPEDIYSRYQLELSYLEKSSYIDDFEIFRCLSEEAQKSSTIISMRGNTTGSIIYFLLSNNSFNPLPVYYYCKECGYYEKVNTHLFGIDISPKNCPNCDKQIFADGFNLSPESVWGTDGKKLIAFDYNVTSEFYPFARRILQSLYPSNPVVSWGMFQIDSNARTPFPDEHAIGIALTGYVILPADHQLDDYPDLISYLENGEPCITGGGWELEQSLLKPIRLYALEHLDSLISLQRLTGIYANEITANDLRELTWRNLANTTVQNSITSSLFCEFRPKTFKDMTSFESAAHSTFSWQKGGQKESYQFKQMFSSESFQKYPCFTRDDFFDYLLEVGIERNMAFKISEQVRLGHASPDSKRKEQFFSLPIPEDIKEVAKNYCYVFPRSHCIEYVLIYAKIAYYALIDNRAFSKIIFGKKRS